MIDVLVARRMSSPGVALSTEELLAHAWPNDRSRPDSARGRLYVMLTRLRNLGLDRYLVSTGRGYMLDPRVWVVEVNAFADGECHTARADSSERDA